MLKQKSCIEMYKMCSLMCKMYLNDQKYATNYAE